MAAFPSKEIALNQANEMSDHHAQVDATAKIVNQNLQGPYAIKPPSMSGRKGGWGFDLPYRNPDVHYLSEKTGLTVEQCTRLLDYMNKTPPVSRDEMSQFLKMLVPNIPGMGDLLGQGKHRMSVETDIVYETRMRRQIGALKESIDGDANVLTIQEQPYDGIDSRRMKIFTRVMQEHGYVSIAQLAGRDVGIWVKKELKHTFQSLRVEEPLRVAVESEPFRGCVVKDNQYLYINLHAYTVGLNQNEYVHRLIALKKAADAYAQQHRLVVTINGDMNLFSLSQENKKKLETAEFRVEPMKGQERYAVQSCEAYVQAPAISPALQHQPVSFSAASSSHLSQQPAFYAASSSAPQPPAFYAASSSTSQPPAFYAASSSASQQPAFYAASSSASQQPSFSSLNSSRNDEPEKVILYKVNSVIPQLAVKFSSKEERTAFLKVLNSKMSPDTTYRAEWGFHAKDGSVSFIPAQIENGSLVAQFSSLKARTEFLNLLPQMNLHTALRDETKLSFDQTSTALAIMEQGKNITISALSFQELAELVPLYQYRECLNKSLKDKRQEEPAKEKHYKTSFFGIGVGCSMEDKQDAVDLICVWLSNPAEPLPILTEEQREALKQGELAGYMEAVYKYYPRLKEMIYSPVSQKQQFTNS